MRALAQQTAKTINEVILDSLRHYRPGRRAPARRKEVEAWRRPLREDRKGAARPETPVEALHVAASGHPARLNFGDCLAYGDSAVLQAPLLFKGVDFGLTDVMAHSASIRT